MDSQRNEIRTQFGQAAADYVRSASHAGGDDLRVLVEWAEGGPHAIALDIATGGGHTALALSRVYGRVVATDITQEMLAAAANFIGQEGRTNVEFATADAEALPFADASFDAVSCRIAPHHFPRPADFVREAWRVLRPGGIFLLIDSVAPDHPGVAAFLNCLEWLRDPTHVRTLSEDEWLGLLLNVGFVVENVAHEQKRHELDDWLRRSRTPQTQRKLVPELLAGAPEVARHALKVEGNKVDGTLTFTDTKLLAKSRRPAV